jgi:hypothetical protein
MSKTSTKFSVLIGLILIGIVISSSGLGHLRGYLNEKWGVDPAMVAVLFLIAELIFNIGIAIMLFSIGKRYLSFADIGAFRLKSALEGASYSPTFCFGLAINRIAWMMPFVYILSVGWGKLPWLICLLCMAEITITFALGVAAIKALEKET